MVFLQSYEIMPGGEYSRFSLLTVAEDVSPGGTSATQRQKFRTDDVESVRNLVRSSDWWT